MKIFITVLVTFFAGMGAGLGTGFAGMSAAAVISPMHKARLIRVYVMDYRCYVGMLLAKSFYEVILRGENRT